MRSLLPHLEIVIGCLCLFAPFGLAATIPPKPIQTVSPTHPEELLARGVDGKARLTFRITETGEVTHVQVTEATDPAFGDAAVVALKKWKFEPATRDGVPVALKVSQDFKFEVPVEMKLEAIAGRPVFVQLTEDPVPMQSLAEPPKLVVPLVPLFPKNLSGSGKEGEVRMKFVINANGVAVNPEIVAVDGDPAFSTMAIISVLRAKWEPVSREGKPLLVAMAVPLRFKEPKPAEATPTQDNRKRGSASGK